MACLPAQRRLWLLDRMDPGNPALNLVARWRLEGRVAGAELRQAFTRIVARHPALRTAFAEQDGEPVQIVERAVAFELPDIDLSGLAEDAALAEVERLARLEARAPFDLSVAPLIRVTHLRVRDNVSMVLVTAHQLVCDAESLGILAREVGAICTALHAGSAPDLPELGELRGAPPDEILKRDEAFWLDALKQLRHFELPLDRQRPPTQTWNGRLLSQPLDRDVNEGLQDVSRRSGCTVFMTTLAALFTLLHRYSGETDIAIGSAVSGRDEAGQKDAMGPFADTLVLRADLSGDPVFGDVLARVRDTVVAAVGHRSTALGRLIELLRPPRDLGRHALFSVNFTFQGPVTANENCGAFSLVDLPVCPAGVLYDLNFRVNAADGRVSCEYNTDLFEAETVGGLLRHFSNLLRAVAVDPRKKISSMPMLDDAERRALATAWNQTAAACPAPATFPKLFDGQARRTPDAVAVVCGEQSLSYRQLDLVSNRLAQLLLSRGIGRGSRVGICLDRTLDLVATLLAVLKSGAAYVPLDPGYPAARLAQIVGDAQPAVVLTKLRLRERLPASLDAAALILLDVEAPAIARQKDRALDLTPGPDDLAYVIYTSGSTGRPKGVQIQHRALANLLWSMSSQPGLTATDTLVSVTTMSFDIAALELFLPLIVGAKLVVAQDAENADGAALSQLLLRHRATVLQATPVTWQILLAAGWRGDPPLKMLCGGEALPRTLADRLLAHGGELWNLYGPTETTIWSSALRVEPGSEPVRIGPPIANTQFYVLDPQGQLVPAGVPGELFIGGDGLALGYLNLPALTHERFVPDTFGTRAGASLYRTGDRVRRRQRGELEFLGRNDHQVKVRGFRIELGEIEAVLRTQSLVADAVAVAGPDASGETAIRAYVVASGAAPDPSTFVDSLRNAVREALPGYMCPASFVVLAALPRMPNGKLDRSALPLPAPQSAPAAGPDRAVSAIEWQLSQLWSAVLGIPAVSVDANFFEVGGHSLLAVRLLARIESGFGRKLSLAALFQHPTIAGQARLLERGAARAFDFRQVVTLQSNGTRPPLIAINNTGIYYALSKHLGPDQPFTSLQLFDPALPRALLPRTLPEIAAGYAQLIRRVQPTGPYALLGWCVAGTLAFEVARQLRGSGQQVSRLILFDTLAPGRLGRLPWLTAVLADYSYRWQLIAADWKRAKRGARPLATFLRNRTIVRKFMARFGRPAQQLQSATPGPGDPLTPEQYDQWLLRYLEDAAECYEPKAYSGTLTLFRSSQEPAGRFLDPQMGWGDFVEGGIDVVVVQGDHFSIFQEPSVSQMAQRIDSALQIP